MNDVVVLFRVKEVLPMAQCAVEVIAVKEDENGSAEWAEQEARLCRLNGVYLLCQVTAVFGIQRLLVFEFNGQRIVHGPWGRQIRYCDALEHELRQIISGSLPFDDKVEPDHIVEACEQ